MRRDVRSDPKESPSAADDCVDHLERSRSDAKRSRVQAALAILYATRIWSHSVVILGNLLGAVLALHLRHFQEDRDRIPLEHCGAGPMSADGQGAPVDPPESGSQASGSAGMCWWTLFWTCAATVSTLGGGCLFDTYFDYVKGHDTHDAATDRTLVDSSARPHEVVSAAVLLYILAVGANVASGMGERAPYWLGFLFAFGLLVSFNYTALLALKYRALGDLHNTFSVGSLVTLYSFAAQGGDLRVRIK